jgi:hypothetical protein
MVGKLFSYELERMWQQAKVACLEILVRNCPEQTVKILTTFFWSRNGDSNHKTSEQEALNCDVL